MNKDPHLKVSFKDGENLFETKRCYIFLSPYDKTFIQSILPSAPIIVAFTVATIFNWVLIVGILSIVWVSVWKKTQQREQTGILVDIN